MTLKKRLYITLGIIFWLATIIFVVLPSWPHIYYRLSPKASEDLASTIATTVEAAPPAQNLPTPTPDALDTPSPTPTPVLPQTDPSLPEENGLIIDTIGVRGEIHEGEDWQNILRQGIWRVPDFGTPLDSGKPIILAAHRWGYLEWSAAFRKLNSFYSLPKLSEGDQIEIVWDQRRFIYSVQSTDTGTAISDYNADLILYTCQLWNSPIRFFVYATLNP